MNVQNVLEEEFNTITPPTPLLWRLEDVVPYRPASPQNATTLKALRRVIDARQTAVALRLDSIRQSGDDGDSNKEFNSEFKHLNFRWMLLERTYKRKNAYYYVGNYYTRDVDVDMLRISPEATIVADNFARYKGSKRLDDVKLLPGHGIVYMVRH